MPVKKRGSSHMAHQWRGPNFLGGYLTGKIPTVHQDAQDRLALHILIFISFLEEPSPEGLSVISFKLTFEPVVNGSCESDSRRRKKARGGPMVWIAFFMNHYKVSQPVHFIERLLGHAIFSMVVASSSIFSACDFFLLFLGNKNIREREKPHLDYCQIADRLIGFWCLDYHRMGNL